MKLRPTLFIVRPAFLALLIFVGMGCAIFKANEAPDAGFLPHPERLEKHPERFPFQKVWLKDYSEKYRDNYSEVVIAPVDTSHMLAHDWYSDLNLEGKKMVHEDARSIAEYMHEKFKETIRDDHAGKLVLVEMPGPRTMIVELALVELVPTKTWLNIAGDLGGFFIPGASFLAGLGSSGSVAIEGRIRDGRTREIIVMFKDRESDQIAPIGIQDLTWYKHAEDEIDDWAAQFVEVLDTEAHHKIADTSPLTFRIW